MWRHDRSHEGHSETQNPKGLKGTSVIKEFLAALLMCACLAGCWHADHNWHVQSWEGGIFTISHEGEIYRAVCESVTASSNGHLTINGRPFAEAMDSGAPSPKCEATVGLVGHEVRPFDPAQLPAAGKRKDADGFIVTMAHDGSSLMLRRWLNEHATTEELLKIASVTKAGQ